MDSLLLRKFKKVINNLLSFVKEKEKSYQPGFFESIIFLHILVVTFYMKDSIDMVWIQKYLTMLPFMLFRPCCHLLKTLSFRIPATSAWLSAFDDYPPSFALYRIGVGWRLGPFSGPAPPIWPHFTILLPACCPDYPINRFGPSQSLASSETRAWRNLTEGYYWMI